MNISEENFETYFLIWLDNTKKTGLSTKHIEELRSSIHYLRTFSDEIECENYIQSLSSDDRIILIVNAQLGKDFIPRIHHISQVTCIYVFCLNKSKHQTWANEYKKVKSILFLNVFFLDESKRFYF